MKKNVLIVDDHELIVHAFQSLLWNFDRSIKVHGVGRFSAALDYLAANRIDLLILDIMIPGGQRFDMIPIIRRINPSLPILICSGLDEGEFAERFIAAGANGFISKNGSKEDMLIAFETVARGKRYVSTQIHEKILNFGFDGRDPNEKLSQREKQVLKFLSDGCSTKEIAHSLGVTVSTISTMKARIFQKYHAANLVDLLQKAKSA